MRNTLRLLVLALVIGPAFSPADKKSDDNILEIQRDVSALDEKVKALQKSQDEKLEALRVLVQQATTASTQVTQDMAALQRTLTTSITTTLSDQQGKISLAVAPLATQMESLSSSVNALTQTVNQMNTRMGTLDSKVKDLSDKVSILNQPAPAPPAPAVPLAPDPNGAPPGVTRLSLRQDAERDYSSGNDELALKEFSNYIKYFHDDEYAPTAGYMIGMVYLQHQKDFESAAEAFQKVIETFPGMNKSQDALFQKARALELGGHKTEAIAAFKEFLGAYPANDYAPQAKAELVKLQAATAKGRGRAASK
jgi:TolA-binding protein